jgi:hypothetical protein
VPSSSGAPARRLLELFDRQIVDADDLDALVDEELRAAFGE